MPKPNSDCRATERKHPWPMVRLGEVCNEIKDRIQSSKISVGEYVTTDNMVKNCGGVVLAEYVPSDIGLVEYHKGDVLIANIRPYLKKIWLADHDGGCSSDVVVFRSNIDGLSSEYLYSVLSQDAYFEYVMQKPRGTKMPRGDRDWMKEFRFPLPTLTEQRAIVARLERELAAVEKIKKGFEALAETSKAEFKAELKEVFEEISRGGAETRRLGDVCELCLGKMLDKAKNKGSYKPYLRNVNVRWDGFSLDDLYEMRFEDDETERYSLRKGDIVMCEGGEPGRCAVWKGEENSMMIQKALHRIRPNRATDSRYLLFAFLNLSQSGYFAERFTGTTIKHLTGQVLREVLIPLPPLPAQREVVARLEGAKAKTEKLEAKAREGVAICETMRKAILKEAFDLGRKG